jgi:hypothetical protein
MGIEQNDEIDLVGIIIKAVRFSIANLITISIGIAAGTFVALLLYFQLPKIYESKMIVLSDILTESYSESINESMGILIREENFKALSARLGITEEEATQLRKITVESIRKDKDSKDNNSTFGVTVEITHPEILPKLQSGLIQYLRHNEFVRIRVSQRQDLNRSMINKVRIEINSLDSLKKKLFSGQPMAFKSAEMLLIDPTNIYSKILELYREQINYTHALELVDSIQLIEGFTVFDKPVKPKLFMILVIGVLAGLALSLAVLGIRRIMELVKNSPR